MRLQLCTWIEVEEYLRRARGIMIPIGSTEQHGPVGLIGTDAICPEVIALSAAEQVEALVAPTITVGMAQHHLAFPGSITLRPTTLIAYVRDVIESLVRHGFDHLYFLNGHGGNIATVTAAFSEIYTDYSLGRRSGPSPRLKFANWFELPGVVELTAELYGDSEGSHGTPSEVSLSYFAYPDSVKNAPLDPPVAPTGTIRDADDYRAQFADGRIGSNPGLSSVEHGERFHQVAVRDVCADYRAFLET